MDKMLVVGGGLAGCALALYLSNRGYATKVYEQRPDIRQLPIDYGRSINLALSQRGMRCLSELGLLDDVMKTAVAMRARAIYDIEGHCQFQAFGRRRDESIYSIQRQEINSILINALESRTNVELCFEHQLIDMDLHKRNAVFTDKSGQRHTLAFDRLFAADGAGSKVRDLLSKANLIDASREWLPHIYKELSLSQRYTSTLPKEHLHLWPRKTFLLLGNPNRDDSITGSLFLAKSGEDSLDGLSDESKLRQFMRQHFPNVYPHMPRIVDEFFNHPAGHLSTVKTSPWFVEDRCLLLGDAAHAIVPFFGQGMNCAFEDCRILNSLIDAFEGDWTRIFSQFYQQRKTNTDAIAEMSMDNYREIQAKINDPAFNLRKALDSALMLRYPDRYVSKHVMVMFTDLPYSLARACGELQGKLLKDLCQSADTIEDINWSRANRKVADYAKQQSRLL